MKSLKQIFEEHGLPVKVRALKNIGGLTGVHPFAEDAVITVNGALFEATHQIYFGTGPASGSVSVNYNPAEVGWEVWSPDTSTMKKLIQSLESFTVEQAKDLSLVMERAYEDAGIPDKFNLKTEKKAA